LNTDLDSAWPNLLTPPNVKFWQHEWTKHGTCSFETDAWAYFDLDLQIGKRINLDATLKAAKIVPDNKQGYAMADFNSTIFASLQAYPELMCEKRKRGIIHLLEIRGCLDGTGASYKNCTCSSNSCGNQPTKKNIIFTM
jgi:ribonuclease T2